MSPSALAEDRGNWIEEIEHPFATLTSPMCVPGSSCNPPWIYTPLFSPVFPSDPEQHPEEHPEEDPEEDPTTINLSQEKSSHLAARTTQSRDSATLSG